MNLARLVSPLLLATLAAAPCVAQAAAKAAAKPATPQASSRAHTASSRAHPAPPAVNWSAVSPTAGPVQLTPATPPPAAVQALDAMLLERTEADGWGCEDDVPPGDWLKDLAFFQLPLGDIPAYLVQAGNTCGRSGDNSPNAALWIVAFRGASPVLFASPQESLNGTLYSVQHTLTHGLPDLVVTWLVSPSESDLTYLKFNGQTYTAIAGAKLLQPPNSPPRIEPQNYRTE